ncbi:hypothetical protein AaE_009731 [Aphanomyces astaci]|uniref:Uncharacterized protein n=1 Tax=Aphanomyces astaci TaxID=112090 RepID=A0A6A5A1U7_APHAT|nr:hypothetical protein AaE_009731 [Aphanomyces astaci]
MDLVGVPTLLFGGVLLRTERMPISNRSHFVFLSHDDEQALAYEAVANILAEEGNMCLKRGDPVYDAVLEVTQHLEAITLHVIDSSRHRRLRSPCM